MEQLLFGQYISLDIAIALQVVALGFVGGVLSGFIGSGGAFFMTPGMMNLGVPGVVAVASNITHKFGKAMVGSRKHGEMGHVDKRLALFMVTTSFIGIRFAVIVNSTLFHMEGDGHGTGGGSAASDLYISGVFICILSLVAIAMLRDVMKKGDDTQPSTKITEFLRKLYLPPYVNLKVADVRVSIWIILVSGLATGYLAGTIGVGGFIGVPAMIYLIGVPTAVAAGSELYLAMYMGAWGAMNYAFQGMVDLRLTMLLYLGSLVGIFVGAYGVKVVNEVLIRLVTAVIILLCVTSRAIAVPIYLRQLGWVNFSPAWDTYFNLASKILLFAAGLSGCVMILYNVVKAYRQRRHIHLTLLKAQALPDTA
jgi:uncharacterized membrane protein YfcA